MLSAIIETIKEWWDTFKVWQILMVYERGVRFRRGLIHAQLEPGLHFKWPLIDEFSVVSVTMDTMSFPTQTIGDKVVSAMLRYKIKDVLPYLTELEDQESLVQDVAMAAIRETVDALDDISEIEKEVLTKVRRAVSKYGIHVYNITFIDFGKVKSLRIMQE